MITGIGTMEIPSFFPLSGNIQQLLSVITAIFCIFLFPLSGSFMFPNVPLTLLNTLTVTLTDVKIIATKPYDNNEQYFKLVSYLYRMEKL